jgi:hypothetical protein
VGGFSVVHKLPFVGVDNFWTAKSSSMMREWRTSSYGRWWFRIEMWYLFLCCSGWLLSSCHVFTRNVIVSAFSLPSGPSFLSVLPRHNYDQEHVTSTDIIICGGGPTGLLCAMMLSQKFPHVSSGFCAHIDPQGRPTLSIANVFLQCNYASFQVPNSTF